MSNSPWISIICGLVGAGVSLWLRKYLIKWIPAAYRSKMSKPLSKEVGYAILISDALFFLCLFGAILFYLMGFFKNNDWRGLGFFMGFAFMSPLVVIPMISLIFKQRIKDSFVAFAVSDGAPPGCLYTIIGVGIFAFLAALLSLLIK